MCFSLAWLVSLAVWITIAIACYVILIRILLPYLLRKWGTGGEVAEGVGILLQCLRVVFWAIVIIIVIYVVAALLSCLWSFGGGLPKIFPR